MNELKIKSMAQQPYEKLLNPSLITKWIIERGFIWQMKLISDEELCRLAHDRGLGFSTMSDDIQRLWQIGLLRADLVISGQPLEIENLILIEQNKDGDYLYADERKCIQKSEGLIGIINKTEKLPSHIELLFHPFRYFVLYHIERVLDTSINPTTLLRSENTYREKIPEFYVKGFQKWSSGDSCWEKFDYWNNITSLAVAADPVTYSKLFGVHTLPHPYWEGEEKEKEFYEVVEIHSEEYKQLLTNIGLEKLTKIISELCREAEFCEPNSDIHNILRFTQRRYRLEKVKGNLGGSMYLLAMAEMIRRSAESIFDAELPEEDESGFGWDTNSYKEYRYGTKRLVDDPKAKTQFLRNLGLDYDVRLRWYVEGQTELGALKYAIGNRHYIELINLKGNVIAKQGKGASFSENLLNDIQYSVYSWISLDGDIQDNVRTIKIAAEADKMFGMFFVSEPDFEFKNFTLEELVEIVWEIALENGADTNEKQTLQEKTSTAKSAKDFVNLVQAALPSLTKVNKGELWGERLMKFAWKNPSIQLADGSKKTRQIIIAIRSALHTANCSYYLSRRDFRIHYNTAENIGEFYRRDEKLN